MGWQIVQKGIKGINTLIDVPYESEEEKNLILSLNKRDFIKKYIAPAELVFIIRYRESGTGYDIIGNCFRKEMMGDQCWFIGTEKLPKSCSLSKELDKKLKNP